MGEIIDFNTIKRENIIDLCVKDGCDGSELRAWVSTIMEINNLSEIEVLDSLIRIRDNKVKN